VTTAIKNICLFNSCKTWGGGEKWHFEAARNFKNADKKVLVCCQSNGELIKRVKDENLNYLPISVGNLSFLNPYKLFVLVNILKKYKIETIILGLPSDVKLGSIAARLAGIKKIYYRRGSAVAVHNTFLNRLIFKYFITNVIVNSEEIKRKFLQNNPNFVKSDKIHVLYNGVDLNLFKPHDRKYSSQNPIILGTAGRLVEQKAQWFLIDVAQILKTKGINFKMKIAGKGPLLNKLERIAKIKNVSNEVEFVGFVSDIPNFLNSIDVFLLSSVHEGSANILIEAMACAKPLVAFNISSIPEVVYDNKNGFLIEFANCNKFAERIIELHQNSDKLNELSKQSRLIAEQQFSYNGRFQQLTEIINS
jgi:glycosyltransferase involved in cell wall biosynthesis